MRNMALNSGSMILPSLFLVLCISRLCQCKHDFFDEVPKELRCSGCELTVKVLDRMLGIATGKNAHHLVDLALKSVCDEKRLSISEYKVDYMVKTCKFMTEVHRQELKEELISHYSKAKKSTYIEMSQQICLNIMRLCPGTAYSKPKADPPKAEKPKTAQGGTFNKPKHDTPEMPYDDASMDHFQHFMKVSGNDAKIVKPVPESAATHDEL